MLQVLVVHPGGPFWASRDAGAWSVPKGEYGPGDDPLDTARREFHEELGHPPPPDVDAYVSLGEVRQRGGKTVSAWAVEGDLDPATVRSNTFEAEWPPRSGLTRSFPEVDRAAWATVDEAGRLLNPAQVELVGRLVDLLAADGSDGSSPPPRPNP